MAMTPEEKAERADARARARYAAEVASHQKYLRDLAAEVDYNRVKHAEALVKAQSGEKVDLLEVEMWRTFVLASEKRLLALVVRDEFEDADRAAEEAEGAFDEAVRESAA